MNNYFSDNLDRLTRYQRYGTRVVNIGDVPLGGGYPIRIQSMTNTDTLDTAATVAQTIRLVDAGCEYVRITAPSVKEARNLGVIKSELAKQGYSVPLIADIHFVPRAAEVAATLIEKVRVNPGNYVDRKQFQQKEYSDSEYQAELDHIRTRFTPLVKLCREAGTALRIGSNHGSLADRILNHYGDTPLGMVESAMEFIRICADENFHELVISMKASNTRVMIQAYRLLVDHMQREGFNYPLHLGVTEAGDGDDARIKSALGIGALLKDGFGDTIRVSLTEAPEAEIPVAISLVNSVSAIQDHQPIPPLDSLPIDLFSYERRPTRKTGIIGAGQVPIVVADIASGHSDTANHLKAAGYQFDLVQQSWLPGDLGADILYVAKNIPDIKLSTNTLVLCDSDTWQVSDENEQLFPLFDLEGYVKADLRHKAANFIKVDAQIASSSLPDDSGIIWILSTQNSHVLADQRRFLLDLVQSGKQQSVILHNNYPGLSRDDLLLSAATEMGGLLNDGLVDGIWLNSDQVPLDDLTTIAFGVLQASRSRMTKTEYIACPSCGRTLFDLEEVTARIRARTAHLKGLKIGIMGCIVNGPGEMADADFGYVGTGPGKVSLYRGLNVVQAHIPQAEAVESLIDLIKSDGCWVEPQ